MSVLNNLVLQLAQIGDMTKNLAAQEDERIKKLLSEVEALRATERKLVSENAEMKKYVQNVEAEKKAFLAERDVLIKDREIRDADIKELEQLLLFKEGERLKYKEIADNSGDSYILQQNLSESEEKLRSVEAESTQTKVALETSQARVAELESMYQTSQTLLDKKTLEMNKLTTTSKKKGIENETLKKEIVTYTEKIAEKEKQLRELNEKLATEVSTTVTLKRRSEELMKQVETIRDTQSLDCEFVSYVTSYVNKKRKLTPETKEVVKPIIEAAAPSVFQGGMDELMEFKDCTI